MKNAGIASFRPLQRVEGQAACEVEVCREEPEAGGTCETLGGCGAMRMESHRGAGAKWTGKSDAT